MFDYEAAKAATECRGARKGKRKRKRKRAWSGHLAAKTKSGSDHTELVLGAQLVGLSLPAQLSSSRYKQSEPFVCLLTAQPTLHLTAEHHLE